MQVCELDTVLVGARVTVAELEAEGEEVQELVVVMDQVCRLLGYVPSAYRDLASITDKYSLFLFLCGGLFLLCNHFFKFVTSGSLFVTAFARRNFFALGRRHAFTLRRNCFTHFNYVSRVIL